MNPLALLYRFLDQSTVTESLGEFIAPEEVAALLRRKDAILQYFDAMVHEKGYAMIVLE